MSFINQNGRGETCKICGDTEKTGYHLNTITCEACRKFFLRNIDNDQYYRFNCNASKNCVITKQNRASCQYCRFQKCLLVGMSKEQKIHQEKINFKDFSCAVCSASASGLHYGVISCESCKQFFKRQIAVIDANRFSSDFKCSNNDACEINFLTTINCKPCRFNKCQKVGMNMQNIKIGRQSNLFKQKLISKIGANNNPENVLYVDINIPISNNDLSSSNSNEPSFFGFQSIENFNNYNENKFVFDNYHGDEVVFEFFYSKAVKISNYLTNNSSLQMFSLNDQRKMLYHATYSLTLLELTKSSSFKNLFDCDSNKYQEIVYNFPSFGSANFNSCITNLFNSIKDINLDSKEYELCSLILILSNAVCLENDNLLFELNTQTTKELIDYMKARRKEYDSSTQLIKLTGDFEKLNLFIQHVLYNKFNQLLVIDATNNLIKYNELINYNRWMQHD